VVGPSRDRPKVLFVIGGLERGGSESQLVALIEAIHPDMVECVLATAARAEDPALEQRIARAGVRHVVLSRSGSSARRFVGSEIRLVRLIRGSRPHVVYAWLEEAALLVNPLARALGVPCAIARRNVSGSYASRHPVVIHALHRAERLACVATANSGAVLDETLRRGWQRDRVREVPNGHVDHGPLPLPPSECVELGYLARFRPEKGHARALQALARIRTATPWRMTFGGDGPLLEQAKRDAERLRLTHRAAFAGQVPDPRAFWAAQHVGVLLSDHEGSPNALIEAGLAGRPLVGTRVGGVADIVEPGGGYVRDPDDVDGIANDLERLIEDERLRSKLGRGAREQALARFSTRAFVEGHLAAIAAARAGGRW
jgi:glycosyltransferase involved in cell wall biosynthesis